MSLVKRTYVDQETVITAENLNAIQDAIIQNEEDIATKGTYSKPSGGIPKTDMASAVQTSLGKADTALQSSDIDSTLSVAGKAADAKKTGDEIYTLSVSVESLWNSVTGAGTKASNALDNEATAYNYHLQYHVGDYCLYQQKMYRCIVETPAAGETWNSSHWTGVTIGEVLSGLKTQIDNFQVATIAETKSFLGIT